MTYTQRKAQEARKEMIQVALIAIVTVLIICVIGLFLCASMGFTGVAFYQCMGVFVGFGVVGTTIAILAASISCHR